MPGPSQNTKQGQQAAAKRVRAALADQGGRRASRPLENGRSSSDIAALLKRYGIITVPRAVYEWGGYRYSNPEDAIAAAKRATRS